MYHIDQRHTCDKEIGSVKSGWKACNRKATYEIASRYSAGTYLHYCTCHAPMDARQILTALAA